MTAARPPLSGADDEDGAMTAPACAAAEHAQRPLLAIVLTAYLMVLIDVSLVFTSVPAIRDDLDLSVTGFSWVHSAYALPFGGLLMLGARAGDLLGRRCAFVVGLAVFAAASVGVGASPTAGWMIAARAVQGAGAAVLAPATLGLLTAGFAEGPARTRAVGAYGAMAGVGLSLGLVLGGLVTDTLSWRVGFLVNAPVALLLIVVALRVLPAGPRRPSRLDVPGALLSTAAMTCLVFGIVRAGEVGWTAREPRVALALVVVLLPSLLLVESRAAQPLLPLRLFRSRVRSGAYLSRLLFVGGMTSYYLFLSQFLQGARGLSALQVGLTFLPMTVVNAAVAMGSPRLVRKHGPLALTVGIAITAVGMLWLSRLTVDGSFAVHVTLPLILIGTGQGLAFGPLTGAGISGTREDEAGAASGVIHAAQQLGGALGLAVLATVAVQAGDDGNTVEELAGRTTTALTGCAVLLAMSFAVAAALILRGPRQPDAGARSPLRLSTTRCARRSSR